MPGYARPPALSATGISVTPTGDLTATNVQSALVELEGEYVYSSASPAGAAVGTLWIDSDDFKTYVRTASAWQPVGGAGATGGGTNEVFYNNDQTVTANYSIPSGKNSMSAGPITINNGVTVTIPNNSVWTVV